MWFDPNLSLRWGPYFRESAEDNAKVLKMAIEAKNENLIVLRSGVEKIAPIFGIENIDQYVELLEAEEQKRESTALAISQGQSGFDDDGAPKKRDAEESDDDDADAAEETPKNPFAPKKK